MGKWREDELRAARADYGITNGEPELKRVMARTQPYLPLQRCLHHLERDLYWALRRDGAESEWVYWKSELGRHIFRYSAKGMEGIQRLIAELDSRGLHAAATYLRNARGELFTVRKLQEQGIAPEIVMVATSAVEGEFREINRRTEVGAKWTDRDVEIVTRLLAQVRINRMRLEC